MKILLLNYEYPPLGGGAAEQTRLLATEFSRMGHEVRVLSAHFKGQPIYERVDGFEVFRVPSFRRHKDRSGAFQMFLFTKMAWIPYFWLLFSWKPDIVLTFFLLPTGLLSWFGSFFNRTPYVLSFRGGDIHSFLVEELAGWFRFLRPIGRMIGLKAAARVAVSQDLADMAQEVFPMFGVRVIENAVALQEAIPEKKQDTATFLFCGRLSFEKNIPIAMKALSKVSSDFRLEIIGDGPLSDELHRLADELGLGDRVRFHGWQNRTYVREWMQKADYLLLLSKVEGMSMSGLEAYSCGLPIIGSKSPGMQGFVVHGETGFQVEIEDVESVTYLLESLCEDREKSIELGKNCRRLIRERYGIRRAANEYITLFRKILKGSIR